MRYSPTNIPPLSVRCKKRNGQTRGKKTNGASGGRGTRIEVSGAGTRSEGHRKGPSFYDLPSADRSHTIGSRSCPGFKGEEEKRKYTKEVDDDKEEKRWSWKLARTNGCAKLTMIYGHWLANIPFY
ncbi:hypothetical protein QLX08_000874 [Tetragonisca angustula]|uniref:Uncharacterized protein n=1 Tax=Tetragonisca angustula TaxID=166442 RepID=A0AAW1AHJ1_9HYME